jgi:hypothetical protein
MKRLIWIFFIFLFLTIAILLFLIYPSNQKNYRFERLPGFEEEGYRVSKEMDKEQNE